MRVREGCEIVLLVVVLGANVMYQVFVDFLRTEGAFARLLCSYDKQANPMNISQFEPHLSRLGYTQSRTRAHRWE